MWRYRWQNEIATTQPGSGANRHAASTGRSLLLIMIKKLSVLICGSLVSTLAAHAALEFRGVVSIAGEERFYLADSDTNLGWFNMGSQVGGFSLASYDREKTILHLRNEIESLELHLAGSTILDASDEVYSEISFSLNENKNDIRCRFTVGQEYVFELLDGRDLTITVQRDAKGSWSYDMKLGIEAEIDGVTVKNIHRSRFPLTPGGECIGYLGDIRLHIKS